MKSVGTGNININFDESTTDNLNDDLTSKWTKDNYFNNLKSENVLKSTAHYIRKYYTPSVNCGLSYVYKRVPFIKWIQSYDLKKCLVKDLTAGLTVFYYFCFHLQLFCEFDRILNYSKESFL